MSFLRSQRIAQVAPVAVLIALSAGVLAAYIANSPRLDRFPDTTQYEPIADHLPSSFLTAVRVPGFPVLMAISSWLPGGRDVGLIALQSLMVVATVVLTYFIAHAALGHRWMAFVVSFVIAADVLMAGFARVAMSETLAVFLTTALVAVSIEFLHQSRVSRLWIMAALMTALWLTRPEWAFLALALVLYVLAILARRRRLDRKLVAHGVACIGLVLIGVSAYAVGNAAVNGYFGLASSGNVGLLGKVMLYRMEGEAPPPYDAYAPLVRAYEPHPGPWPLMAVAPFNDRNYKFAGEFARAVILRDPLLFGTRVLGTLISANTSYDAVFLRMQDAGPFYSALRTLLALDEKRYAAFVLMPSLAFAWLIAGLLTSPTNHRVQILGVLGTVVFYGLLAVAFGGYDEFGRIHMPINPVGTVIVFGTLALNVVYAWQRRGWAAMFASGLTAAEIATIALIPGHSQWLMAPPLAAIAIAQAAAIIRWHRVDATETLQIGIPA